MSMDEQIARAKEEALSRKAIMEKVEKWILACDEERWLEEYSMVRSYLRYTYTHKMYLHIEFDTLYFS